MTANPLRDVSNVVSENNFHQQQQLPAIHQDAACASNNNSNSMSQQQLSQKASQQQQQQQSKAQQQQQQQQQVQPQPQPQSLKATTTTTTVENDVAWTLEQRTQELKALHGKDYRPEHDYTDEIYNHLFDRQLTCLRDANYLSRQTEVEERMRVILIDWLVDVNTKFRQRRETFFLAVDIVDRFLMRQGVSRSALQLIGVTAILIAAKHEEIWAPEVKDCAQITANTYTKEEIIRVERDICSNLRYRFTLPTAHHFMLRLMQLNEVEMRCNHNLEHIVMFYLELSAVHYGMLHWQPSTVALAALLLGRITWHHRVLIENQGSSEILVLEENADQWVPEYLDEPSREFCKITALDQIAPAVRELLKFAIDTSKPEYRFRAVQRKFSGDKFGCVTKDPIVLPPNNRASIASVAAVTAQQQQLPENATRQQQQQQVIDVDELSDDDDQQQQQQDIAVDADSATSTQHGVPS